MALSAPEFGRAKSRQVLYLYALVLAGFLLTSLAGYFEARQSFAEWVAKTELLPTTEIIYSEVAQNVRHSITIASMMAGNTFVKDWVAQGERNEGEITAYLTETLGHEGVLTAFFISYKTRRYYHPTEA